MTIVVSIVSYNICLSVCPPLRFNGAFSRAKYVAESIYDYISPDELDVICLQELVVQRESVIKTFIHHPFHTNKASTSFFSDNIRFVHSGLATLSKWPIVEEDFCVFRGKSYHLEAFMAKAVQYSKIILNNKHYIHVFNTHTQAWINERSHAIRKSQFQQIGDFISSKKIPANEPVYVVGDFNLDYFEQLVLLQEVMNIANLQYLTPEESQFSFDPSINILTGTDDADEYKTTSFKNGCYDDYVETGICSCCPKQLLDAIAVSKNHLIPKKIPTNKVIHNKVKEPFVIFFNVSTQKTISFPSDHFPVFVQMEYEELQEVKEIFYNIANNTSVRLQKTFLSFSSQISPAWICVEILFFVLFYFIMLFIVRKCQVLIHSRKISK